MLQSSLKQVVAVVLFCFLFVVFDLFVVVVVVVVLFVVVLFVFVVLFLICLLLLLLCFLGGGTFLFHLSLDYIGGGGGHLPPFSGLFF